MANYDYKEIKKFIQKHSDYIESVSLGMAEDWFWTAEEVYSGGVFKVNLDEEPEIAGIKGSQWATPSMMVEFKDGEERMIDCFVGSNPSGVKPDWLELGCLSQPCQHFIDSIRVKKLEG